MNEILKIISELNIPKQVLDKGYLLFEKLFGKGMEEYGYLIQDKIKFRRFKNQLKILSRASELLERSPYKPKEISLKLLVPLVEFSSLEEEPVLQEKWARLIASVSIQEDKDLHAKNYIDILNRLSINEAKILDYLFDLLLEAHPEWKEVFKKYYEKTERIKFYTNDHKFDTSEVSQHFNFIEEQFSYYLENIMFLGLLRWDLPKLKKSNSRLFSHFTSDRTMLPFRQEEYKLTPSSSFLFTNLGLDFVKSCRFLD